MVTAMLPMPNTKMKPTFTWMMALAMLVASFTVPSLARADIILHDLKGRTVTLAKPASHIVVDDGRMIVALSFLTEDPVRLIAAWPHDVDRLGQELYGSFRARFPSIDSLPRSTSNAQDMVVEQIFAARPDLVVLSLYSHPAEQQLDQLAQAGIPVVFVDFVSDPFDNTDRSLEILAQAIGRSGAAEKIVAFRDQQREMIRSRLAGTTERPAVFMETHASTQEACCNSPGTGSAGKFLDFVHARNIGDILKNKPFGQISLEYVVASRPDIYVATGGAYMAKRAGLLIGPAFGRDETRQSLDRLLARPGFRDLPAVKAGAVHGLSQQLFNSPLDILALDLLAKWTHPALFKDLDVEAAKQTLNGLMAVPLTGSYWTE